MENNTPKTKYVKQKRPWMLPSPVGYLSGVDDDCVNTFRYTQADMLREYYPQSHRINDPLYYPDIYVKDVKRVNGKVVRKYYKRPVPRCSYAFQQIITTKRTLHLVGNDIQFEHTDANNDKHSEDFEVFRRGWTQKNIDIEFGKAVLSSMIVADCAIVFWMQDNKLKTRTFSYINGDKLYPHFKEDGETLSLFARTYKVYDDDGDEMAEYMDIWTETEHYVFRMKSDKYKSAIERIISPILQKFNLEEYDLVSKEPHGFKMVPVAYHRREDGPCWVFSQDTIDSYEMAKSQMAQNNEEYGEPALVVCSDDEAEAFVTRNAKGTIKEYHIGKEDKVEMLQGQSAAESYMKQCEDDLKLIYKQSFIVDTPEMKSGDLPAAALKIMYSIAYEKAYEESLMYQNFLNQIVKLFSVGYGIEKGKTLDFAELINNMRWWIEPYIHQNESAVVADIVSLVKSGIVSKQTACQRLESIYAVPGEYNQVMREQNAADNQELLHQIKLMKETRKTKEE